MPEVRITVRVRPGASRTRVGGRYGEEGEVLVIAVHAPPVDGAANDAVVRAVADSFGLRPRQVELVSGHQARTKVLQIQVDDINATSARLQELLDLD